VLNFPERSVREAILNAICHRNYFNPESVVVKLNPKKFEVTSPGSLPEGVTPKNIVDKQSRRNRLLAEALEKCGLIERSGLGVDLMIESAVFLGQDLPVFDEPDGRFVHLALHGNIDKDFSLFMNTIDKDSRKELSISELITLDYIRRNVPISELKSSSIRKLMELNLIRIDDFDFAIPKTKRIGRKYGYLALRELILREINIFQDAGCSIKYLSSVTQTPQNTIRKILSALRDENLVETSRGRGAKWVLSAPKMDKAQVESNYLEVKPLDLQILDALHKAGTIGMQSKDLINLISEQQKDKLLISKMLKEMRIRRIIYSSGNGPGTRWYAKPRPEQSGQLAFF
jgi:ATP-dependent DNA helicase RecG